MKSTMDRFLSHVAPHEDGCWYWTGYKCKGYGRISIQNREMYAHQLSYRLFVNSKAMFSVTRHTDHVCNNKSCVNPKHLRLVSAKQNILRGTAVSAVHAKKTECKNGHPFTEENTRVRRVGKTGRTTRICRTCANALLKRCYQKRKNAELDRIASRESNEVRALSETKEGE